MKARAVARGALAACLVLVAHLALAQGPSTFAARLDWVPISGAERTLVAGGGSATATLSGSRLSITGCFEGLPANAARVTLHHGVATGARGPAIAEIEITKSTDGAFRGEVALRAAQKEALLAGQLYLQLYAERGVPPDNAVLWGWLLTGQKNSVECAAR